MIVKILGKEIVGKRCAICVGVEFINTKIPIGEFISDKQKYIKMNLTEFLSNKFGEFFSENVGGRFLSISPYWPNCNRSFNFLFQRNLPVFTPGSSPASDTTTKEARSDGRQSSFSRLQQMPVRKLNYVGVVCDTDTWGCLLFPSQDNALDRIQSPSRNRS
jgi:hypothetical protein